MRDGSGDLVEHRAATFGPRKVTPRVCIADGKQHVRAFLSDMFEALGFVTVECTSADELSKILATDSPDLVLLGIASDGIDPATILQRLVRENFGGKVLTIASRESIVAKAVHQVSEEFGLAMLSPLTTPFTTETLRERIAMLLPHESAPSPAVHVGEALHNGWLELWYQTKINPRTLVRCGAEALVRMRHPTWGVVPPAYFIPEDHDPNFCELSQFVIGRVLSDWHYLLERNCPMDLSINLPAAFLREPQAIQDLYQSLPTHPAFRGLTIEINSEEAINEFERLCEIATDLSLHNISLSIDNVGANWPELMDIGGFPFTRLKADAQFVTGCGDDRLRRLVCRHVVELAEGYGAETVAVGVESRNDLIAMNEIGFDLVQGYLFGKPMPLPRFARSAKAQISVEET